MSYNGRILEIPMLGGLTGTRNQALIRPDQLIVARNVQYYTGTIRKEGGAVAYNATPISGNPKILGGWDWIPTVGVQRMVVIGSDGKVYKDSGAGTFSVTLASALTVANIVPVFVEAGKEAAAVNRKLFLFTGSNAVQVLDGDGATMTALTTPPADWSGSNQPTVGANHEGRLWGAGNANDPNRVYYSTITDHTNFTGAGSGSLPVYPGEGQKIVGLVSFKGLLIVWKFPTGIYYVDTTDPTVTNWKVKRITSGTGGVSPQGQVMIDDDVYFLDAAGNFQLLSSTKEFGNMAANNLSQKYQLNSFMNDNINMSKLPFARGIYYGQRREVAMCLTSLNGTDNDVRLSADFNISEPRFRYSDRDSNVSIWNRLDSGNVYRPVIGDNNGTVWLLDQAVRSKAGLGYQGQFQTPHIDFAFVAPTLTQPVGGQNLATRRKLGQFLEVVCEPTGNWTLSVDIIWDGFTTQTVQFNMGVSGVGLGTFVIGTDVLGADAISNRKRRIVGEGRRFSLSAYNSGVSQDFSISRFYLHFKVGDERIKP